MSLTISQLHTLRDLANKAAQRAGAIIKEKQGTQVKVLKKDGGDTLASCVVTEVDMAAEKAILELLTPTLKDYNLGLLTEESTDDESRFNHDYFWCIDPLDGTLAYSRNEDGYSTSIALVSRVGVPIIGVVYNPRTDTLYHAIKDQGAFKNDAPFKVSDHSKNLTLLFDQSYLSHPDYESHIRELKDHLQAIGLNELKINPLGGAVMNAISTIELAPALYYKLPKKTLGGGSLWDFAASSVIQSEAGGLNSDYYKEALELNRRESTFMNHRGIIFCSSENILKVLIKRP
ncbi:hypothetical protein A9Q84_14275 [Halobacteriovorax marinus]|uniref:Inositol monophosphatase n=1 Tax=Halobacteriovorax marinus TaxID=97084 RepID=A0A1Y5FAK1_9BACT|nr:hypothetical protein A9Q84_14275 [Halobacteriovorax marinus]